MKKKKINLSLICFYNDLEQLENTLLKSYKTQNVDCNLVLIDNCNHDYSSAVLAIRAGLEQAKYENIIIAHQDIWFCEKDALYNLYENIISNKNKIIGVAGVIEYPTPYFYSSIYDGPNKERVSEFLVNTPVSVLTVDECLFGFNKSILKKIDFDPVTCDNWHFYAVDLCYQAQLNNIDVIVVDSSIWHSPYKFSGKRNHAFYKNVLKLQHKYKNDFDKIFSCCINIGINKNPYIYEKKEQIKEKIPKKIRKKYISYKWSIKNRLKKIFKRR